MKSQIEVKHLYLLFILMLMAMRIVISLENGLARTPPMGWLAWERFKCNTECDKDPLNCISENLFIAMADKLVSEGYKDVGYEYINIDDCWMDTERDKNGDMASDPVRFHRGIKFLADYMHDRGLKLGIYQDYGFKTCMGYPGIIGHIAQDAKKFAEWGVDMIKLDGCYSDWRKLDGGYIAFGKNLQKFFKKPVLYSCSWPYYQWKENMEPNYTLIASHCNMWRNYHDITDKWKYIETVIQFYGDNQEAILPHIGPGHWSDPDMLMTGNFHLSLGQERAQMAIWAIIPAPLLMSNDLRAIKPESKAILLNKKVIAVNQDPLGNPGRRIYKKQNIEVWKRSILPSFNKIFSYAFVFLNRNSEYQAKITVSPLELGLDHSYFVTELFVDDVIGIIHRNETFYTVVPPMDVRMFTFNISLGGLYI